jgi:hypothetical protein
MFYLQFSKDILFQVNFVYTIHFLCHNDNFVIQTLNERKDKSFNLLLSNVSASQRILEVQIIRSTKSSCSSYWLMKTKIGSQYGMKYIMSRISLQK